MKIFRITDYVISRQGVFISICISIALLPINLNLNSYAIFLSVLVWAMANIKNRANLRSFKAYQIVLHALPFIIALVGLIYTSNFNYGFDYIGRVAGFLIFPILFASTNLSRKERRTILYCFLLSCLFRLGYEAITFCLENPLVVEQNWTQNFLLKFNEFFSKNVIHPTYFSIFLILNIFTCTLFFIENRSKIKKTIFASLLALICFFLILLTSKMALSSFTVVVLTVPILYLWKNFERKKLLIYLSSVVIITFSGILLLKDIPNRAVQEVFNYYNYLKGNEIENYYSYEDLDVEYDSFWWEKTNRIVIWKNSYELVKRSPWIGYGTGDVQDEMIKTYKKNKELWRMQFFNSHNQFIDYQLRYGILGSTMLFALFFYYFSTAIRREDYYYLAFLTIVFLCLFSENILQRQWGVVFFTFFNSLLFFNERIGSSRDKSAANNLQQL